MPDTTPVARPTVAPSRDLTHPLDRLKGIIRGFVAADVLLFVGLFLTLWFWLGVGLDYGLFKLTGLDIAQQLTPALRIGVTLVLLVTLVALIVWRVTVLVNKELSLSSLALVLEKRHPKLLGDRLITAIEMADVEYAREQGYSADMVRHTIAEARERMAQVNVRSVFNWGRLWLKGGLIVGVWVLGVVAALGIHAISTGSVQPARGTKKLADVCGIFTERNYLFQPTPWPRRALVEIVEFDDDGHPNELRIGKGSPVPPKVTARAVKWVVEDDPRANPDGWRAMRVSDLKSFGIAPPDGVAAEARIDDLEREYGVAANAPVFAALTAAVDDLWNTRKLRVLVVPEKLRMRYDGLQTRSRNFSELVPDATGRYSSEVTNLTESVRFTVSAEDYTTARRQITLVPPPTLIDLYRDEYQPAYLHYAGPILSDAERDLINGADPLYALRGRMRKVAGKKISITSDKSVFSVPYGSEMYLTAEADKDLKAVEIVPVGANPLAVPEFLQATGKTEERDARTEAVVSEEYVPLEVTRPGGANPLRLEVARDSATGLTVPTPIRRFTLAFVGDRAVRQLDKPTEFKLRMTDTDNVTSVRTIAVTAVDDAPPQVEVLVDPVIRRVGGLYMVTPIARIPFLPDSKISDDTGLSSVRFEFKKTAEEAAGLVALRGLAAAAVTANSVAPIASWAMPATVLYSQTQFEMVYGSTIPQQDSTGTVRLPGISVPRFENDLSFLQRQTLEQVAGSTVPRAASRWADLMVQQELGRQKVNAADVPPADLAKMKAELIAKLRAAAPGDLDPDRPPHAVRSLKLSDPFGDSFDLQQYMPELLEKRIGEVQQRYRVELFVTAKDVNVELTGKDGQPADPKSARNLDPIRLLVVSEQDLLVEIGKDEELQVTRMEDALKKATDGRDKMDREFNLIRTLPALDPQQRTNQILSSQVRLTDITQDLAKVRELLTSMRTEYEKLYREMEVNRFGVPNMRKYRNEAGTVEELMTGYLDLLGLVLDDGRALSKVEKSMEAVRNTLSTAQAPTEEALTQANNDYSALMRLLQRLAEQVTIGNTITQQVLKLKQIIDAQQDIGSAILATIAEIRDRIKRPVVTVPNLVTVQAGKTTKVKLQVRWQLYPETSLFIGVEPPAAADLTVPKEIIVKAKGDEPITEVEFEVTGGAKAGVNTILLRPGPYRPVELTVEVTK